MILLYNVHVLYIHVYITKVADQTIKVLNFDIHVCDGVTIKVYVQLLLRLLKKLLSNCKSGSSCFEF